MSTNLTRRVPPVICPCRGLPLSPFRLSQTGSLRSTDSSMACSRQPLRAHRLESERDGIAGPVAADVTTDDLTVPPGIEGTTSPAKPFWRYAASRCPLARGDVDADRSDLNRALPAHPAGLRRRRDGCRGAGETRNVSRRYFEEATRLCERDAGRLWGVSLCGPMVIVDQATGTRATSQPEPEGPPPRLQGFVDGPVSWGGCGGSASRDMLPENDADARQQTDASWAVPSHSARAGVHSETTALNEHLDTLEGRVWMQLEWRALRRAVESSGGDRAEAIADALAFRGERRRRFPGAADSERREEIREGLASYTGIAAWASSPADAHRAAASALAGGESQPSFVGNFEAASGPAYGVLLDDLLPAWRRQVRSTSDLGDLLASATNRPPTTDVAAAAARYDGATLRTAEEARDRAQQVRVAELRRRFVDGPVLTMPAAGTGTSDTTGSVGIPGAGSCCFATSRFPLSGAASTPTSKPSAATWPDCSSPSRLSAPRSSRSRMATLKPAPSSV